MFTGIIERVGTVVESESVGEGRRLTIRAEGLSSELVVGDSIALDGACQTVVETSSDAFAVDSIGTTLSRTILGTYRPGRRVNLERALVLGSRLDGHLVQGHVDAVGMLDSVTAEEGHWLMTFRIPDEVWRQTILHGSIAINGISLTVNALPAEGSCQVGIIPHTWENTNLGDVQPGDGVNLEGDLIGKYVGRMLAVRQGPSRVDVGQGNGEHQD